MNLPARSFVPESMKGLLLSASLAVLAFSAPANAADAGTPVQLGLSVGDGSAPPVRPGPFQRIIRSRAELPRAFARVVPARFDFERQALAVIGHGRAASMNGFGMRVVPDGKDVVIVYTPPIQPCPPCRGVYERREHPIEPPVRPAFNPAAHTVLVPIPRDAANATYRSEGGLQPPCPPCLAP